MAITVTQKRFAGASSIALLMAAGALFAAQQPSAETRLAQRDAMRQGGLRAAAAVTGHYVGVATEPDWGGPANLRELVEASHIVVMGQILSNVGRLTLDGKSISTLYTIRVSAVLKGRSDFDRRTVVVAIPGGRVSFEDGTWAQINAPGFRRPTENQPHLWFLKPAPVGLFGTDVSNETSTYVPMYGPLGVYPLHENRAVYPSGRFESPLAVGLRRQRLQPAAFVAQVRAVLARQ